MATRSPLLRLQSDEKLVALIRRGNDHAFEALVARYSARLLAFCRHMLGSAEDAEDVLQEVFAAAYTAMHNDDRPLAVRPWLYKIARNRSLNHLRRTRAVGQDDMDLHLAEHGASTADAAHKRMDFELLVTDVGRLAETQRTALVLREMEHLSYEHIAETMDTTVPAVKSLLVRARIGLAEAAEARALSCEQVRLDLGAVAEGLGKLGPAGRRHLKECDRCAAFQRHLRQTNRALAAVLPLGPLVVLKKLVLAHVGHAAAGGSASSGGAAAGAGWAGAAAGSSAIGTSTGGVLSAVSGLVGTKAVAGLAAAAIVGGGAVEVHQLTHEAPVARPSAIAALPAPAPAVNAKVPPAPVSPARPAARTRPAAAKPPAVHRTAKVVAVAAPAKSAPEVTPAPAAPVTTPVSATPVVPVAPAAPAPVAPAPTSEATPTVSDTTVLPPPPPSQNTDSTAGDPAPGTADPTPPPSDPAQPLPSSNTTPPPPPPPGAGQ